jgi:hypothetical protein
VFREGKADTPLPPPADGTSAVACCSVARWGFRGCHVLVVVWRGVIADVDDCETGRGAESGKVSFSARVSVICEGLRHYLLGE